MYKAFSCLKCALQVAGTVLHKYGHHEEFKCMALRADCPEVVVGTNQVCLWQCALGYSCQHCVLVCCSDNCFRSCLSLVGLSSMSRAKVERDVKGRAL